MTMTARPLVHKTAMPGLGLSAGQTMEMTSNDRRSHRLTIDTVVPATD